jgi:branched-subunit amino acid transport protein
MDGALKLWAVIFAVGALNYLSRVSFIALFARRSMPPLLARALRYVPAAMLTALILPMIVDANAAGGIDLATPRVAAAVVAAIVAYFTRSSLATLSTGMATLWLLQWLIP